MKILMVDDEPAVLDVLQIALNAMGYIDIVRRNDARAALAELDKGQFDCFLLDIQMPGMSGIDLVEHIRAHPRHAQTPIVMNTSLSERAIIDEAFSKGATDYITKPLDRIEFSTRIRNIAKVVEERKQRLELEAKLARPARLPFTAERYMQTVTAMRSMTAFENYVMMLSNRKLMAFMFLSIRVENAARLYDGTDEQTFEDLMSCVSEAIQSTVATQTALFAHIGGGDYVLAFDRAASVTPEGTIDRIKEALPEAMHARALIGGPQPRIVAGPHSKPTVFSAHEPGRLLQRVIGQDRYEELRQDKPAVA